MNGITALHKEMFVFFCLDLDELFLFTQGVTGQEVSAVGFRLKSPKISEKGNRSAWMCAHTQNHHVLLIVGEIQTASKKALRFKMGHIWRGRSRRCDDDKWRKHHPLSIFFSSNDNHYKSNTFQDWSYWNSPRQVQMVWSSLRMKGPCCGV